MERTFSVRVEQLVEKKFQELSKDSSRPSSPEPFISSAPQTPGIFSPPFQQKNYRPPAVVSNNFRENLPRNSRDISYFEPFRPPMNIGRDSSAISSGFRSVADRQSYLSIHLLEDSKLKINLLNETLQSFHEKVCNHLSRPIHTHRLLFLKTPIFAASAGGKKTRGQIGTKWPNCWRQYLRHNEKTSN